MIKEITLFIQTVLGSLGYYGAFKIDAGFTGASSNIFRIKALEDSVVTISSLKGSDISNYSISSGDDFYGNLTSIECVSGKVIVYPLKDTVIIS